MSTIGVDIGTGSVRVCINGPKIFKTALKPIKTNRHGEFTNYITQSSREIYEAIIELLEELVDEPVTAISFAATCSMVVMESVCIDGQKYLKPCAVEYDGKDCNQDIILWMDNRAVEQANYLNTQVDGRNLAKIGGKFIPEMGLPKLTWLHENKTQDIVCFELHDWYSYLFLVGGGYKDGLIPYVVDPINVMKKFPTVNEAMDGSIKGWTREFLDNIGIGSHVSIGRSDFNLQTSGLLPIGVPLGFVHGSLFDFQGKVTVAHGCIDCYAGWLFTIEPEFAVDSHLSMIAGTSTCFILSSPKSECDSIPGIWGPFKQLLPLPIDLFAFGQPATGKLFELLFENYSSVLDHVEPKDIFQFLEDETTKLERTRNSSITDIIKNYFWYIDQHGNRSPYNDFTMSESVIDGCNSSDGLASITNGVSLMGLVIRYNLALEFLSFQTKQILQIIDNAGGPSVNTITISGSQGNNRRFMNLLATVTGKNIKILNLPLNLKYNVVKGSSIISTVGHNLLHGQETYENLLNKAIFSNGVYEEIVPDHSLAHIVSLLSKKYSIFVDMAITQQKYRQIIASM